ncbi:phosphatase PAP2 family protein [Sphingomonas koreensis]|nr:phosphatase PAP2 family protein [Sphingomonas koreensis]
MAAGGAVALAVLLLVVLGATIARGHQFEFDRAILLAMRRNGMPTGPAWVAKAMIDITALGGVTVLVLLVTVVTGLLATLRLWVTAGLVLAATISGSIAVDLVKQTVGRVRPQVIDHLVQISSASFPSGHSANSAIVYLTMATLLTQIIERAATRWYVVIVAVLLVTAIGCSRVYLGVHWPSDVLAGWSFGTLWALAWWAIGARVRLARAGE